jgi:hypothetical protein
MSPHVASHGPHIIVRVNHLVSLPRLPAQHGRRLVLRDRSGVRAKRTPRRSRLQRYHDVRRLVVRYPLYRNRLFRRPRGRRSFDNGTKRRVDGTMEATGDRPFRPWFGLVGPGRLQAEGGRAQRPESWVDRHAEVRLVLEQS